MLCKKGRVKLVFIRNEGSEGYYFVYARDSVKVKVCGSCGILWSQELRLKKEVDCPNCGYAVSKAVEI